MKGVDKKDLSRGQVLSRPGSIAPYDRFKARAYLLAKEEGGRAAPIVDGYRPQIHFWTTDVTGVVRSTMEVDSPGPGTSVTMDVELMYPVAMEEGERFTLKEGGRVIGRGAVIALQSQTSPGVPVGAAPSSGPACIQSYVTATVAQSSTMWELLVKLISTAFGSQTVQDRRRLREVRDIVGTLLSAKGELLFQIDRFGANPGARSWADVQWTLTVVRDDLTEAAMLMKDKLVGTEFAESQVFADLYTTLDRKRQSTLCELSAPMPQSDAERKELALLREKLSSEIDDVKAAYARIGDILAQR